MELIKHMIYKLSTCAHSAAIVTQTQLRYFLFHALWHWFTSSWETDPLLGVLFLGWSCRRNDGPVISLEGITVSPEKKVREELKQSWEGQEIGKSWPKQRGLDESGGCHVQYYEGNNSENREANTSSENNMINLAVVCSIKKNTNLNNQGTQLSSTHL